MKILKKKNILNILLIVAVLINMIACMEGEPGSTSVFFYRQPAFVLNVQELDETQEPVKRDYNFKTLQHSFIFHDTTTIINPDSILKNGDYILADFRTEEDGFRTDYEPGTIIRVHDFQYTKVNQNEIVMMNGEMKNENTDSISSAELMPSPVNNRLFFSFTKKGHPGQAFDYEMIFNEDSIDNSRADIPPIYILHIRAKTIGSEPGTIQTNITNLYAFNMDPLLQKYFDGQDSLCFKVKYKYGIDGQNKDIYKDMGSPRNSYVWKTNSPIYSVEIFQ